MTLSFVMTDARGVREACEAAAGAAPGLAKTSLVERAGYLRAAAGALTSAGDRIVALADEETHLGVARLSSELARTTAQLELFADAVLEGSFLELMLDSSAQARPDLRRMLHPLGPVGVFAASNFPLAFSVAGGDTASALAAGCPVVVKAHEGHPRLSALVSTVLSSVLPAGWLSVVYGRDAGRHLVLDEAIAAVGFTGSTAGGRALFDLACARPDPIPFYGELGSINPVVVTRAALDVRAQSIVDGFVGSFTLGQGQFCTKPGLLFLPADHGLEFTLRSAVGGVRLGELLGPWIADRFHNDLHALRGLPSVRTVVAGPPALFAVPAADFSDTATMECFGPASLVVEYTSEDELFAALSHVRGSLTFTVHGEDPDDVALARRLVAWGERRAGRIIWNGWPTGVAVTWAMQHGGPWPSTTSSLHTSVGVTAMRRFLRPVTYQNMPEPLLPKALYDTNPLDLPRRIDGQLQS